MGIGPGEVMTLLLGWAFIALLVAGAFVLAYWVIRKAVAAGIRDAREDHELQDESIEG